MAEKDQIVEKNKGQCKGFFFNLKINLNIFTNFFLGSKSLGFTYLILDATMWSFIDSTSAREFILISNKLDKYSVKIVLAGASSKYKVQYKFMIFLTVNKVKYKKNY